MGSLIVAGNPKEGRERGMEEVRGLPSLGVREEGRWGDSPGLWRERGRGPRPGAGLGVGLGAGIRPGLGAGLGSWHRGWHRARPRAWHKGSVSY